MKTLLLFTALAITSGILHAAPVRFLAWDGTVVERKLGVVSGEDVVPVQGLHTHVRSPEVNYTPGEAGLVVRALDRTTPDGKPADFKIDKATRFSKVLVVLFPDSKSPAGLRGFAVDDSNSNFAWGDFRLINATGKPLGLVAGTVKKVLPANWEPVDLKGDGTKGLPISIFSQDLPQKPSYTAVWSGDEGIRRLVFVTQSTDARLGTIAVKVIVEDKAVAASGR